MLLTCGWLVAGCQGDGPSGDGRTDSASGPGITMTATDSAGSDSDTGGDTSVVTSGVDSTGGACPEAQVCGEGETIDCCEADEVCTEGVCVLDCGGPPPCGDVCCDEGAGEICYVGSCIVPSGSCSGAACATNDEPECPDGEICDPTLGQCVPDLADESCAFEPEVGVFDPVPRFTWGFRQERACDLGCQTQENCVADICQPTWPHIEPAADDLPNSYQCVMSPMVADIDLDCVPEIIFNTYPGSSYTVGGTLRAIRGDDGSKVFTVTDPNAETDPGASPAIGDINGDGVPEIIAPAEGSNLIAFTNTGAVMWTSENYAGGGKSGSPSLADFDGDGIPEIAIGRNVFDNTGTQAWSQAPGPTGAHRSVGPLSCGA
ncbi:MAG: VCBS repeat-containing protein, partial [Myxococcota bacterium]